MKHRPSLASITVHEQSNLLFIRSFPHKSLNCLVKTAKTMEYISESGMCRSSREPVDPNLWEFSPQVRLYGPRVLY